MDTAPPQQKIHWWHEIKQYGAACMAAAVLFMILSLYIFYQRGLYDQYGANRIFADVAAVLLGIVLLLGPLSRYFAFPDRYLQYRKELGIVAFFFALVHAGISLFLLPAKISLAMFLAMFNAPFFFGLAATIALIALFSISNECAAEAIGRKLWWRMQNWGVRIIFAFIFIHVFLMKWAGWMRWYRIGGGKSLHPELPNTGLFVGWFMAFVVLMRLAEFAGPRFFRIAWYASAIVLPTIYVATLWWGMQFAK